MNILVELLLCVSLLKVLLVPDTMPRTNDEQVSVFFCVMHEKAHDGTRDFRSKPVLEYRLS
eukprot:SAG11_NODE_3221_length_2602_cov_1.722333_2_plen_61_part_00